MDDGELGMLADTLEKTMTAAAAAGTPNVEDVLAELGWLEMLDEIPDEATALVFRLLGETGHPRRCGQRRGAARRPGVRRGGTMRAAVHRRPLGDLGAHRRGAFGDGSRTADPQHRGRRPRSRWPKGRLALGWWLAGSARAMLVAGPPARGGPGPVRPADRVVPGGAPPARRDAGRHRGRGGRPCWRPPTTLAACWPRRRPVRPHSPRPSTASRCSAASASPPNTICTAT